jgi:hypothetical protein
MLLVVRNFMTKKFYYKYKSYGTIITVVDFKGENMYEFVELETEYGYPIEVKIIDLLEFYDIPKENIVNIRIITNHRATVIFETNGTKYEEIQNKKFENVMVVK